MAAANSSERNWSQPKPYARKRIWQLPALADIVDIRVGDALETLRNGVGGDIDLLLLDGAFSLYLPVLKLLEPHLSEGALVIAENAIDDSGDYLTYVRNPDNGYRTIPLPFDPGRGNEMSVRTV